MVLTIDVKGIVDEDFTNYKKPSMFVGFSKCSFKCDNECGKRVCQNSELATAPSKKVRISYLVDRYIHNPITKAIVCGGLEPFDTFDQLLAFVSAIRKKCDDDIVVYTGYTLHEILDEINVLKRFHNVIVKFGRFMPNQSKRYDYILGVTLASSNQYAERIDNMRIVVNNDDDLVQSIREQLKSNGGYCPCVLPSEYSSDTKCPCKAFRDQTEEGECHCGLYIKLK